MTQTVPALDSDAEIAIRRSIADALSEVVRVIASVDPMFEMHRGMPPADKPRNSDEALELLRASTLAWQRFRAAIATDQARWAQQAVLRGGLVKDVAEALNVSSGAVSKRWPALGALSRRHLWFLDSTNAGAWVSSCLAIAAEGDSLVDNPDDPDSLATECLSDLAGLCTSYAKVARNADDTAATQQWHELVRLAPGMVEELVNPRRVKTTTDSASAALESLRLVWRAYRAGISVQDQTEREREHRTQP